MDYDYFMNIALTQAKEALSAGEFPVGCVVVCDENILATGMRKGTGVDNPNEIDHAEMVALKRLSEYGKTFDAKRITVFSTLEPCLMCFGAILLIGAGKIVYAYEDVMGGGTSCDLTKISPLYRSCNISIVSGVMRQESIRLFKKYFADSSNNYLNGTLLAKYTLEI